MIHNITFQADPMLTIHINGDEKAAIVRYSYAGNDTDHAPTCFQTADMPRDDQEAAAKIDEWLRAQCG